MKLAQFPKTNLLFGNLAHLNLSFFSSSSKTLPLKSCDIFYFQSKNAIRTIEPLSGKYFKKIEKIEKESLSKVVDLLPRSVDNLPISSIRMALLENGEALSDFHESIRLMANVGFSVKQARELFHNFKLYHLELSDFDFTSCLRVTQQAQLSPQQIIDFFEEISIATGESVFSAFEALPEAFQAGLSPEQILDLFKKIAVSAEKNASPVFSILAKVFPFFKRFKLDSDQIFYLLLKISNGLGSHHIYSSFYILLRMTSILEQENLSPQRIVDFFSRIVDACGTNSYFAFQSLPVVFKAGLNSEQIVDLFSRIVDGCGTNSSFAFQSLPVVFEAGLNSEQIVDLFSRIVDVCGTNSYFAFQSLPVVFEAGLNSEQIVDLFSGIVDGCGTNSSFAFQSLPVVFEAGLNSEQIVDLFAGIADQFAFDISFALSRAFSNITNQKIELGTILKRVKQIILTSFLSSRRRNDIELAIPFLTSLALDLTENIFDLKQGTALFSNLSFGSRNQIIDLRNIAIIINNSIAGFRNVIHNQPSPDNVDYIRRHLQVARTTEKEGSENLILLLESALDLAKKIYSGKFDLDMVKSLAPQKVKSQLQFPKTDSPSLEELANLAVSVRKMFEENKTIFSVAEKFNLIRIAIVCDKTAYALVDGNLINEQSPFQIANLLRILFGLGYENDSILAVANRIQKTSNREELKQISALLLPMLVDYTGNYHEIFAPIADHQQTYVSEQYRTSGVFTLGVYLEKLGVVGGNARLARQVALLLADPISRDPLQQNYQAFFYHDPEFPQSSLLVGGKGSGLNHLAHRVPENTPRGFVLPPRPPGHQLTDSEKNVISEAILKLEDQTGKKLGSRLKVSVRSGGAISMPGAMSTQLNVDSIEDVYRYIEEVYNSWNSEAARAYRMHNGIPEDWGTPVNIVAMIDGTKVGGSGVALSRIDLVYGKNVTGDSIVSGNHAGRDELDADLRVFLETKISEFENELGYPVQVEFTVESNQLWFLQIRRAPLDRDHEISWHAKQVKKGVISKVQAIEALGGKQILESDKTSRHLDLKEGKPAIATGAVSGGQAINGEIAFTQDEIRQIQSGGAQAIFVTDNPDAHQSTALVLSAGAMIVSGGNPLAHLFDVSRNKGIPFVGALLFTIGRDDAGHYMELGKERLQLRAGAEISIDPQTASIYQGKINTVQKTGFVAEDIDFLLETTPEVL